MAFAPAPGHSQIGRRFDAALCLLIGAGCGSGDVGSDAGSTSAPVCPTTVDAGVPSGLTRYTAAAILDPTQAAGLCVALQACFPLEFPKVWTSFNECVNGGGLPSLSFPLPGDFTAAPFGPRRAIDPAVVDFYDCVLGAGNDCTKIAGCLALDSPADTCSSGQGQGLRKGTCSGSVLHGCTADGYPFSVDCARYDAICVGNEHACDWAPCPANISSCDGPHEVKCTASGKTVVIMDCSSDGADFQCAVDKVTGDSTCVTNTRCPEGCDDLWCSGSISLFCFGGQLQDRRDCAQYSRFNRCSNPTASCDLTGSDCTTSIAPSCQGTQLVYCDDGFTKTADCSPFGTCSNGRCVRM